MRKIKKHEVHGIFNIFWEPLSEYKKKEMLKNENEIANIS